MLTDQIFRKAPEAISKIVDQEAIVILPGKGEVKVLNEVGARVWELINGEKSLSDLVDLICEEYDVTRQDAEHDILIFVEQMIERKLVIPLE